MSPNQVQTAAQALAQRGALITHHDDIARALTIGSRVQIFTPDAADQTCELVIETGGDLSAVFSALRGRFLTRVQSLDAQLRGLGIDTTQLSSLD